LTTRLYLVLVVAGSAILTPMRVYADCDCPPGSVEQSIRQADQIFRASVVSANYEPNESEIIEFVVRVEETIRGTAGEEYRLTTTLPDSCGIPVRLGFHDNFILQPGNLHVTSCSGSGRDRNHRFPFLQQAVLLVDYPASEVRESVQLLNGTFPSGTDRETVVDFFEFVSRIDPAGHTVSSTADQIQYRGIVVHFRDGKFEKAGAL